MRLADPVLGEMNPPSALPRTVWILGFVSLLMDISSEMIHSLLPLYLTVGLGASALAVGLIEGAAEATALAVKVFSGTLSDALGRRKWIAAAGYGLGAAAKPLFALASGPGLVFAAWCSTHASRIPAHARPQARRR